MINKEQHVFSYNLVLIALMNGIIALWLPLVLLIPNCTQNHAVTYTNHWPQCGMQSSMTSSVKLEKNNAPAFRHT